MPAPLLAPARATDRAAIDALLAAARAADGHMALGEAVMLDLDAPGPDSEGFVARDGHGDPAGAPCGFAHVAPIDTGVPGQWTVGLAVHPDCRHRSPAPALLDAVADHIADHGGGRCTLWLLGPTATDDAAVRAGGFSSTRELVQMRVTLPLDERPAWPPLTTVRTFEPGRDEEAWLAANNRAFAGHPEQGDWTFDTLRRRMAEPWFDPGLFLLAFDPEGLGGFDWLKLHHPCDDGDDRGEPCGEIYVIGVDPARRGSGLGRALAIAGLDLVAERGITTGMLHVARENDAAVALYRGLGFEEHRIDRAYERRVEARR